MLVHNARLITWGDPNEILDDHAVYVENGVISEIGPSAELLASHPEAERQDARGQVVMPGNICGHTHFYSALSRGMGIPGAAPKDFPEILGKLWWPLDESLNEEDVRYSALAALIDAVRHGTTTIIDHHASPNAIDGSLDIVAEAVEESGLSAVLCYEVTDRGGKDRAQAGIRENVRFINRCANEAVAGGRVAASFGLHASLTLTAETLDECRTSIPDGAGFHIHAAEHPSDQDDSMAKSGMRVIDRLEKHGILGEKSIVAHAVHVDAREIELLAQSRTWVTHQPRSNMNNAVGMAQVESMVRAGVRMGLGNDGFSNAMWEEWKVAYLVHKAWNRDPRRFSAMLLADMAVKNNAELTRQFFPTQRIGVLEPGAQADMIFVDYDPPTELSAGNLPWHIVFGFHESMITTTIANGKVLMKDRVIQSLDVPQIMARARELSSGLWERYAAQVPAN
jgi:putative selenium metabolism protein SsnA